ncbi:hypothetical protein JW948_02230 [bacterium]|nr:hypothetical protein [bacterium]
MPANEHRMIRFFYSGSVSLSILLSILTVQKWNPHAFLILFFTAALLTGRMWSRRQERRMKPAGILMTLAMLNLLFMVPELGLRAARFRYESGIQFGHPRPTHFINFITDKDLFYTLDPKSRHVNAFGFPGHDIKIPKPANTVRLLYLGDSCTQQGYPAYVEKALNRMMPDSLYAESVPLALSGYTSYQGRIVAEKFGLQVEPDAVFVYYGWNDHWLAFGARDSRKKMHDVPRWFSLIQHARVVQWVFWMQHKIKGTATGPLDEVRVPPDEYDANLRDIVTRFKNKNVPVILITAPSAHHALGVPDYLIENQFARSKTDVLDMHDRYNETVRAIARDMQVPLIDLAEIMGKMSDSEQKQIFLSDGIHFTEKGLEAVADDIVTFLKQGGFPEMPCGKDRMSQP